MEISHYERIGGAEKVRALVQRFYQIMDEMPEYYDIRKLHLEDLQGAKEKLFKFLSGWMGGPPLFVEEYGQPMLRQRHMPFSIGSLERDQWMLCMGKAMQEVVEDAALRGELNASFKKVADSMRNRLE